MRPAFDGLELFDPHRPSSEGERHIGAPGGVSGGVDVDVAEGVQRRAFDSGEGQLQSFGRGDLTLAEGLDE